MRPDAQQLFPLRRAPSPRLRPVQSAFAHSNRSPRGAPATFSRPQSRGGAKKAHWAWVAMRGSRWEYFDRPARHAYVHLGPGLLTRPRVVVAGEGEVVFDADTLHLPFGVSQCCSGSSCSAGRSISAKAPAPAVWQFLEEPQGQVGQQHAQRPVDFVKAEKRWWAAAPAHSALLLAHRFYLCPAPSSGGRGQAPPPSRRAPARSLVDGVNGRSWCEAFVTPPRSLSGTTARYSRQRRPVLCRGGLYSPAVAGSVAST